MYASGVSGEADANTLTLKGAAAPFGPTPFLEPMLPSSAPRVLVGTYQSISIYTFDTYHTEETSLYRTRQSLQTILCRLRYGAAFMSGHAMA
eukprot:6203763-Pleurochrysis_carterae.AAC.3